MNLFQIYRDQVADFCIANENTCREFITIEDEPSWTDFVDKIRTTRFMSNLEIWVLCQIDQVIHYIIHKFFDISNIKI